MSGRRRSGKAFPDGSEVPCDEIGVQQILRVQPVPGSRVPAEPGTLELEKPRTYLIESRTAFAVTAFGPFGASFRYVSNSGFALLVSPPFT